MKAFLIAGFFFLSFVNISAQECNCCTPHQQAFDFWLGKWTVYDTTGQEVGKNTIIKLENGCILTEHWKGASGSNGSSYNYFDRKDSTWNQLWVDNQGNNLKLKGKSDKPGRMTLRSELKLNKNRRYYDKITWTKVSKNEVIQLWVTYREDDSKIAEIFKGIYRKE